MTKIADGQANMVLTEDIDNPHPHMDDIIRLQGMAVPIQFKPNPPKKHQGVFALLDWLPELTGFGRNVTGTGALLTRWGQLKGSFEHSMHTANSLLNSFKYSVLALAIIDFIRIPVTYLAAWQLGEKIPVSATKNARWFYASLSLSLSLAAVTMPAVAPVIAIVSSSLGLLVSLVSLGKFFYRRHRVGRELDDIGVEIERREGDFRLLQAACAEKVRCLQQAIALGEQRQIRQVGMESHVLQQRFDVQRAVLQQLHDKKYKLELKQSKRGMALFFDKALAVGLASLVLIGVTISLFFPPIGLAVLTVSAGLGMLYLVGRILSKLLTWGNHSKSLGGDGAMMDNTAGERLAAESVTSNVSMLRSLSGDKMTMVSHTLGADAPQHFPGLFSAPANGRILTRVAAELMQSDTASRPAL